MITQTVSCPSCKKSLRSDRPISPGTNLRCPACRSSFTTPPPVPQPRAAGSPFGPFFWGAVAVSALLGGSIITAAVVLSMRQPAPQTTEKPAEDQKGPEAKKELEEREKALEAREKKLKAEGLAARAKAALDAEKFDEAEELYTRARELDRDNEAAIKGLLAVNSARLIKAQKDKAAKDDGKREADRARLLAGGKEAFGKKQYARAVELLEAAKAISPTDRDVLGALADARTAIENDAAEKKKLDDFKAKLAAANLAMAANRFADAADNFTAAVALMPGSDEANKGLKLAKAKLAAMADAEKNRQAVDRLLADARASEGKTLFKEALDSVNKALRLVPGDAPATRLRAALQKELREVQAANARRLAQANAFVDAGQFADAIGVLNEATRAWAEDDKAKKALLNAEKLAADARAGVAAARNAEVAYLAAIQAGDLAMMTRRYGDAVNSYLEALKYQPGNLDLQRALSNARIKLKRQLEKRTEYDRLLQVGRLALARRQYNQAIAAFEKAAPFARDDFRARDFLRDARYLKAMQDGQTAYNRRNKTDAVTAFEAALSEKPGDFDARRWLQLARMLK